LNLNQINNLIKQVQTQVERGRQTVDQVKSVTNQVNTAISEVKQVIEPAKDAIKQVEQIITGVTKDPLNSGLLRQLSLSLAALHAIHQAGRPGLMGELSAYNKAIIAFVMSALVIVEVWTGYSPGITEGTLVTILAVLTPILVWLFPNYPRA
jgi:ABC-type transporter Mla subunit MlaD